MTSLALIIGMLAITVVCVALGERLQLPYPILMMIAMGAVACIPGLDHLQIDPHLILPLFLPPLLFATAQRTSWSVFRYRWRTLLILAVGLTAVTAFAVAGTVKLLLPGIAFPLAVMVGAMVAPPDPVAVEAVAGPAKMPRRLLTMLQTEGLFNDAVAIVLFTSALTALTGGSKLGVSIVGDFVIGAIIAIAIGLVLGFLYRIGNRAVTSTAARTAISVVMPFAAYMVAEELHASGVIAVVVTALETNRKARVADAEARMSRTHFWNVTNLLVTGLAFGLMGMQLRDTIVQEGTNVFSYIPVAAVVCVVVIVVRFLGMRLVSPVETHAGMAKLRWKDSFVLTWCGMRGLATLALALAIPTLDSTGHAIDYRNMMIIVASSVMLVTLVPTGFGIGALLRALKLQDDGSVTKGEITELTDRAKQAALSAVQDRFKDSDELTAEQMQAIRSRFQGLRRELDTTTQAMAALGPDGKPLDAEAQKKQLARAKTLRRGRELMVAAQTVGLDAARAEVISARTEPGVDPEAADHVLHELDLQMLAAPPQIRRRGKTH
jgi:Na+/H+ antiporter